MSLAKFQFSLNGTNGCEANVETKEHEPNQLNYQIKQANQHTNQNNKTYPQNLITNSFSDLKTNRCASFHLMLSIITQTDFPLPLNYPKSLSWSTHDVIY